MGLLNKKGADNFAEPDKNRTSGDSPIGNFLRALKNRMGIGSPERNATDTYERGMKIVPACIRPVKNEATVKQYNIAVLRNLFKFERAEGRIQVTTKRVIFRAAGRSIGGRTTLQQEFAINEIAGMEARKNYKFSFIYLIFAVIIFLFADLIINPSIPGLPKYLSLFSLYQSRISSIMMPAHLIRARANEQSAITQRKQTEDKLPKANANLKAAQDKETKASGDTQIGIVKTRKVPAGRDWFGSTVYKTETYRDKTPEGLKQAQDNLNTAIAAREKAEKEVQDLTAQIDTARANETKAINDRVLAVKIWKVSMTLAGLILGLGGLLPFFLLYKRFGLKLLILNLSIFGFTLALVASGFSILKLFIAISEICALVCIFLFCFRPNLIISIKNKGAKASIDICKGMGFREVIPTEEAEAVIREIGAIICDIQKLGDAGMEKWINNQKPQTKTTG